MCNRDTRPVYPSVSTRFSPSRIRNGLSSLRRLASSSLFSPFLPRLLFYPPFFAESLPPDPISLSPAILLPGDASKVTGTRVPTLHVVRIPAGPIHPWGTLLTHSRAWRDTHTRIWRSRSAGKLLLSRESLKTITSLQVRERRQERKTISLINKMSTI